MSEFHPPSVAVPLNITVDDACRRHGLTRARVYALLRDGTLPARKAGKQTLIDCKSLDDYVANLPIARFGEAAA